MSRNRIFIFLFVILFPWKLFASLDKTAYIFRHYDTEQGLSNNWVFSFLEDDQGFIWVGTRDGLNRFDGYDFQVFDETNSGLKGSYIISLHKAANGILWVGTQYSGLYQYSPEGDVFLPFVHNASDSTSISNDQISAIGESSDGMIWVGTYGGGLNSIDPKTLVVKRHDLGSNCMRIRTLEIDQYENIWIGTSDGLFYFDRRLQILTKIKNEEAENLNSSANKILSLHLDILGRLWVGTQGSGLYYFDKESKQLKRLQIATAELRESSIRKINSQADGRILIGTANYGVVIIDPVTSETQYLSYDPDNPNSLINNSVYDILFDRFGSLWIANAAGGVNFYNQFDKKFTTITHIRYNSKSLSNSNARSFYQDKQGRIWIGTRAGVNLELDDNSGFITYKLSSDSNKSDADLVVLSMLEDSKGRFWIGSFSGGAKLLDIETGMVKQFYHPDDKDHLLEQQHVYDILEDNEHNIWMATLGGVYVLDHAERSLLRYTVNNSKIHHNGVKALLKDVEGRVWLGTSQGLNYFDSSKGEFEPYPFYKDGKNSLNNINIFCLFENDNGDIWVGTEGDGINIINFENSSVRNIGLKEGLPDNNINAIEKDNQGNFWISTNKGLSKLNENNSQLITFSREDGLQANEFYPKASLFTKEGEMYFGGSKGMNKFLPSSILINPMIPEVIFTRLYIKNVETRLSQEDTPLVKPISMTKELRLSHKQSNISIHFAGLGYINPEKYEYSYFLDGFEDDWGPYGKQRFATYTNLEKGSYALKVRVRNNDNQYGEDIAELKIIVLPPPWASWWAFLLYYASIIGLLFLFRYYVISWTNVKNELDFEKREKAQIKELNLMKLRFFTNISHEFRTPLTLLRGYIDKLMPSINDRQGSYILERINHNSNHLLSLLNELMEFRKAESGELKLKASEGDIVKYTREIKEEFNELALQHEIDFTFQSQFPKLSAWFDPGKIEKVLYNLISNAFKYTGKGGMIEVVISTSKFSANLGLKKFAGTYKKEPEWIEILVSDTGIGIPGKDLNNIFERFFQVNYDDEETMPKGTGIGLAFSKRLIDLHKGELLVNSQIDKGSKFIVRLPMGSAHLESSEIYITERERFNLRIDYPTVLIQTFGNENLSELNIERLPGKPLVLIIEDNLQIVNLLKDSISENFNLIFALDGTIGIEMVKEENPSIVITDIMMPGISGIEVCNKLKSNPETSHIPIIILTARNEIESQLEGLNIGADAFLSKPFSTKILVATIDNILLSRDSLHRKYAAIDTIVPSDLTRNKIDEQFLQKVITNIENNLADSDLDVAKLAIKLGMSRSVLYRKIKAITGNSIQEFILGVKLRKAKYLLINTNKSISEVSYLVGFSNTKHFSTCFKKKFESSPSDFRK